MTAPRLCVECRHYEAALDFYNQRVAGRCRKSPKPPDYVFGSLVGLYPAQAEREAVGGCGSEGRWWEPKP